MLFSDLSKLIDISNQFNTKRLFSSKEHDDIVLSMSSIMDNFICENPLIFSSPYFHEIIEKHTVENIMTMLKFLYTDTRMHDILEEEVKSAYNYTMTYYFKNDYPLRSFDDTFIRVEPNVEYMTQKIEHIKNKPQPTQQTNDWYLFRHELITASSAWKIFKSQSAINEVIRDKCKPIDLTKYDSVNTNSPMHHGHKYEPLSIMYYETKYNTKVEDFGCIQHDTHKFLGASPDGIIIDKTSPLYGRMLEIKNPVSRQLTGIPKEDYWIQMQLQMETCNLNECDFLETVFKEYEDEDDFMNDGDFQYSENGEVKGVIVYFIKNQKPHYEYAPLYCSNAEFDIWFDRIMEENSELTWVQNIYWRLEDISCVLVLRNKTWCQYAIPHISNVWDIIVKERETGYEHRMPKKKVKKPSIIESIEIAKIEAPIVEAPIVEALPVEAPIVEALPVEAPPVEAPPVEVPPVKETDNNMIIETITESNNNSYDTLNEVKKTSIVDDNANMVIYIDTSDMGNRTVIDDTTNILDTNDISDTSNNML